MADKVAKLIMVTENNNNKYYNMFLDGDTIRVEYGRVDSTKMTTTKPASQWDRVYRSKVRKGYVDKTELFTEKKTTNKKKFTEFLKSRAEKVKELVTNLQNWAKDSVSRNYSVESKDVTQAQIDKAQELLDKMANCDFKDGVDDFNQLLLSYFMTVPRKMKKVQDNLLTDSGDLDKKRNELLQEEQDILDVMAGQVKLDTDTDIEEDDNNEELDTDIIKASGLEIEHVTDKKVIDVVKSKMGEYSDKLINVYEVTNNKNRVRFDNNIENFDNKTTELFWHGSRNENWWSIITSGLKIRPSNATHTGSMFGDGIYFASKYRKSYGYTSGRNSYWASGNSDMAILSLYEVHVGKQKNIKHHDSGCYSLNYDKIQKDGYDSVFAHGGADLKNDEFIIYNEKQSTIKYLVTVKPL